MSLNANALTTVATLRQWLTQSLTPETDGRLSDANLEALINRGSGAIESWCDRALVAPATALTYTFDGDDGRRLVLPEWPVVSVSTVSVDGESIPARPSLLAEGYVVRPGEAWIELVGYRFSRGIANVTVSARLGYDATLAATDRRHRRALDDLGQACLLLCAYWFEKPVGGRLTSGVEGHLQSFQPDLWPEEVKALLLPYRRLGA
ncbi:MAG: hypothetical protein HYU66_15290 [Armatimonadetes bacterium]|nr:hypothetical protein [Armatimonadota bacterium]